MWPPESEKGFKENLPSDLVFELTRPIFKLDRDITQKKILVKFHKD